MWWGHGTGWDGLHPGMGRAAGALLVFRTLEVCVPLSLFLPLQSPRRQCPALERRVQASLLPELSPSLPGAGPPPAGLALSCRVLQIRLYVKCDMHADMCASVLPAHR